MGTTRRALRATSLMVAGLTLAACDGSDSSIEQGPAPALHVALGAVPKNATHVTFGDTDRWRARHGVSNASPDELTRTLSKGRTASTQGRWWQGANLKSSAGWGVDDTAWNAVVTTPNGTYEIYRFRDSVDMAKVGPGLVKEGYADQGNGVYTTSIAQTQDSSGVPRLSYFLGTSVRVDTGHHQLLSRMAGDAPTLPAAGSTLMSGSPAVGLVNNLDDVDYADIALGDQACSTPARLTAAQARALGLDRFKPIRAKIVGATSDTEGVVRAAYDSADTAGADLKARRGALAGPSAVTGRPFSQVVTGTVSQQASLLDYAVKPRDQQTLSQIVQQRDEPWAWCPAG